MNSKIAFDFICRENNHGIHGWKFHVNNFILNENWSVISDYGPQKMVQGWTKLI